MRCFYRSAKTNPTQIVTILQLATASRTAHRRFNQREETIKLNYSVYTSADIIIRFRLHTSESRPQPRNDTGRECKRYRVSTITLSILLSCDALRPCTCTPNYNYNLHKPSPWHSLAGWFACTSAYLHLYTHLRWAAPGRCRCERTQ